MMLVSPQKFFGTLFHHFKHPKDPNSSMSKIDFLEKNDTFVRYCPSMLSCSNPFTSPNFKRLYSLTERLFKIPLHHAGTISYKYVIFLQNVDFLTLKNFDL